MYNKIIFKTYLMNLFDISFSLQRYPVNDLNPDCASENPNLTIIFFHGIAYGINDEWKHGQHEPLMVQKNAYVGHRCGSRKT
jgi:hypothetical protein